LILYIRMELALRPATRLLFKQVLIQLKYALNLAKDRQIITILGIQPVIQLAPHLQFKQLGRRFLSVPNLAQYHQIIIIGTQHATHPAHIELGRIRIMVSISASPLALIQVTIFTLKTILAAHLAQLLIIK
jgi:hypothetical protein